MIKRNKEMSYFFFQVSKQRRKSPFLFLHVLLINLFAFGLHFAVRDDHFANIDPPRDRESLT
jgi:hypothetical protein